jgi:hypothetical protein
MSRKSRFRHNHRQRRGAMRRRAQRIQFLFRDIRVPATTLGILALHFSNHYTAAATTPNPVDDAAGCIIVPNPIRTAKAVTVLCSRTGSHGKSDCENYSPKTDKIDFLIM